METERADASRTCKHPIFTKGQPIVNTLKQRQNGRNFADDIFKCIFLNENACISLKISLEFVPKVRINNIPALVQIMAWRRPGDKPLSEPMVVSLTTHICVTRPQWVKIANGYINISSTNRLRWTRDTSPLTACWIPTVLAASCEGAGQLVICD